MLRKTLTTGSGFFNINLNLFSDASLNRSSCCLVEGEGVTAIAEDSHMIDWHKSGSVKTADNSRASDSCRYHTYDSREDDKRRFDREGYRKEHDRRGRYGEGSEYEDSSRYPVKYQSEYSVGSGNYGGYPDAGVRYGGYLDSGDYGYSGKPHHTPLKNKSLPLNILTSILSQRTGRSVKPGNIYQNLYDLFGEDASPTVKVFVRILLNKLEVRTVLIVMSLELVLYLCWEL